MALDPSKARPVDVALVNGEVFMNLCTAGPVSEVSSKDMSTTLKKVLGPTAIIFSSKWTEGPVGTVRQGGWGGGGTFSVATRSGESKNGCT